LGDCGTVAVWAFAVAITAVIIRRMAESLFIFGLLLKFDGKDKHFLVNNGCFKIEN
jgi:hypothetical protein